MPFQAGRSLSAENTLKNFPFTRILKFLDISTRSKFGLDEILFGHIGLYEKPKIACFSLFQGGAISRHFFCVTHVEIISGQMFLNCNFTIKASR